MDRFCPCALATIPTMMQLNPHPCSKRTADYTDLKSNRVGLIKSLSTVSTDRFTPFPPRSYFRNLRVSAAICGYLRLSAPKINFKKILSDETKPVLQQINHRPSRSPFWRFATVDSVSSSQTQSNLNSWAHNHKRLTHISAVGDLRLWHDSGIQTLPRPTEFN